MSPDTGPFPQHRSDQPEPERVEPDEPTAKTRDSRWPGWIWAVPLAAVLIVAYLAFRQLASGGPTVTVIFPEADGIQGGQTDVEYQGLKVGQVESVKLEKDMRHVRARISLQSEMTGHVGPGTLFWIAGPSLTNLSSISSIISGPKVGIQPANGKKQKVYYGLEKPPVVPETRPGRTYVLHASTLGNINAGTQVYFRDLSVGKVEDTKLLPDQSFDVQIFIKAPYDKLVHLGSRFWSAGAVQFSMQGAGPRVQMQSLPSLLTGAIDFETPLGAAEGAPAPSGHQFRLFPSKTDADYAPGANSVLYRVVFGAKAGTLKPDASVDLAGTQVGTVQSAQLIYDPDTGQLREQAVIAIDPSRITLASGKTWPTDNRGPMDALMRRLIAEGLRARPGSSIPMVGPKDVSLTFVQGAQPASLEGGNPPLIPSAPGESGLGGLVTAVNGVADKLNGVAAKLNGVPLDQIADHINTITGQLAQLSQSPALSQSLQNLDAALANVRQVTATARADVPAVLASLRRVASSAQSTVEAAHQLINSTSGTGPLGIDQAGLGQTLYQLGRAADAVRQLADYLSRHPSALIRGRG